jgi:apolipoprotein N-acyltransferase
VTVARIAHPIILASGARRALIAFAAGAVSALAMPPFDLWPVMFVTVPALVWLVDGVGAKRWNGVGGAAAAGWFFGFGYFLAGLYWVGYAFLVDAKIFGWLMPVGVVALPAGLAVFPALGVAMARVLWTRGVMRILVLAATLTIAEWLRGHVLTGFPWNAFGYALTNPLMLAQASALVGLWGMTFISLAIFASPAALADDPHNRRWLAPIAGVLAIAGLAAFGALRLAQSPSEFVTGVRLRIMQPNLQQDEKFNYSAKQDVMRRYLALSDRSTGPQASGVHDVTHLIWPESAFPFFLSREGDALVDIAKLLSPSTVMVTGAARPADTDASGRTIRAYNSVYVIDHDGSILTVYDKVHLVPFGEYLPFQSRLERLGFMQLTKVVGGFIPGDRHRAYPLPHAPRFLPLICYEIIFPGEAVPRGERPDWLLNLTNDGWFGISPGPYQHFHQARVRAIEEGLPLVRAANTGISAVIDPVGRVIGSLPLGTEGVLDSALPRALSPTIYSRLGDGPVGFVVAAVLIMGLVRRRGS